MSKVMRIPDELVEAVTELLVARRVGTGGSVKRGKSSEVPRVTDTVNEGFESPATEYGEFGGTE